MGTVSCVCVLCTYLVFVSESISLQHLHTYICIIHSDKACPAEELGIQYVMQVDVQLLTKAPHQIRGQLASLGIPIVGDAMYGGGVVK